MVTVSDPAIDLAEHLETEGIGKRSKGAAEWWIVVGQLVTDSQPQIALLATGGLPPSYSNTDAVRRPTVQVRVLGDVNDYQGSRQCADAIYAAVDGTCDVEINGTRYLALQPLHEPAWLGYRESDRRPEWSLNVQMIE